MPKAVAASHDPKSINWVTLIFIITYHLALFIALPLYLVWKTPSWSLLLCTFVLVTAAGMSITTGYHRLYSHRTYRTRKPVEWILLFFGTLATESSVFRWVHDHRLHHRFLDGDRDPYGTPKGFWHSHVLWMFKKGPELDDRYLKDLKDDKLLAFQHRYYALLMALTNLVAVLATAWITGDLIGAFVFAFLLRMFITHHTTWFINSLAHMWGSKPYASEHSAVNNFILAFLTFGEGYHNFHHTFAGDYRNGIRWYQFDPSKYLIWLMSKAGLASDLKRTDALMIKKRLVQADRKLLIDHLNDLREIDASAFVEAVEKMSEKLSTKIASAKALMDRYRSLDRKHNRIEAKELRMKFRALRQEISRDLKTWRRLCRLILKLEPSLAM